MRSPEDFLPVTNVGVTRRPLVDLFANVPSPCFCLPDEKGFIRTATVIDPSTDTGSVRINPVGLSRVVTLPRVYGDCKAVRA